MAIRDRRAWIDLPPEMKEGTVKSSDTDYKPCNLSSCVRQRRAASKDVGGMREAERNKEREPSRKETLLSERSQESGEER